MLVTIDLALFLLVTSVVIAMVGLIAAFTMTGLFIPNICLAAVAVVLAASFMTQLDRPAREKPAAEGQVVQTPAPAERQRGRHPMSIKRW